MRWRWLGLLLLLTLLFPAPIPAQVSICPGQTRIPAAINEEVITVSNTAVGFTVSKYAPPGKTASMALVTLETDNVRYTVDGATTPTSTVGHLIQLPNGITVVPFIVCGHFQIVNFKAIRTNTDAKLTVTYFQ